MKTKICLNCNNETKWVYSSFNKFCNNKCQNEFRFKNETLLKFLSGNMTERNTIKKCLTETVGYHCTECGISEWRNKPLTLQVSHQNGDPSNNSPENLHLICPNCHSQTSSFGGKNKGFGRKSRGIKTR